MAAGYSRMVCYLPGARVQGISEQLHDLLKGEGEQPGTLVHVGTNDIDRKRDEMRHCKMSIGIYVKG